MVEISNTMKIMILLSIIILIVLTFVSIMIFNNEDSKEQTTVEEEIPDTQKAESIKYINDETYAIEDNEAVYNEIEDDKAVYNEIEDDEMHQQRYMINNEMDEEYNMEYA